MFKTNDLIRNAIIAALYAALNICQGEEERKISLREFLSWSIPFVAVSTIVCYLLGMVIWVIPFAG